MMNIKKITPVLSFVIALILLLAGPIQAQEPVVKENEEVQGKQNEAQQAETVTPIKHFLVIMQDNHSFDNYFGTYPGADGIPEDICMPMFLNDQGEENIQRPECIEPFPIGGSSVTNLDHSNSTDIAQEQLNNGKMNGFVDALIRYDQDGEVAMGFYDANDIPYYWNLADHFVLFDRFFSSAHASSVWNRNFWVAGQAVSEKDYLPLGGFKNDALTIFDRLEEQNISWKFYVEDYDPSLTYHVLAEQDQMAPQLIRVPLLNFPRFVNDPNLFAKIVDMEEYYTDLRDGTLPSVAYMVSTQATEQPPRSLEVGEEFVKALLQALKRSEAWDSSAFMITYDDWGGWYDHVPPPNVDEYGYGYRVPALLVSPYAKKGVVDSTVLDFTSIMKFIEQNWSVEPVAERDANANSFIEAFDFEQSPREPVFVPSSYYLQTSENTDEPEPAPVAGYKEMLLKRLPPLSLNIYIGLATLFGLIFVVALLYLRRSQRVNSSSSAHVDEKKS